jgi:tetratricopeptide (TPR) repeat protein
MAIEDLHWIDKSTEDSLKDLIDSISGAKVFLIFTYRPEFVLPCGGKSYHNQITLNRLSNRECIATMTYLLGTEEIDKDLEDFILEKTEGIPFFIEEFVKSLKALKIIDEKNSKYYLARDTHNVTIPSTIQDVIMARVDALPEGAKEVLQTGSVIEREFGYELIRRVTGMSERDLLSYLSVLRESELLFERGIFPESDYIFKHALTRDVVYNSMLTSRKKELHEDVGNAIEESFKGNIGEYFAILADHYIEGKNYEKGAAYSKLAAKKAEKTVSIRDAVTYSEKRVKCIEKLPQTNEVQWELIDARTALGLYHININLHNEAKKAVSPIIDLAKKLGRKKRLAQIHTTLGTYYFAVEDNYPIAFTHYEEALKLSEEAKDVVSSVLASAWFGIALASNCEFEKASFYMDKAIRINEAANALWGVAAVKSHLSLLVCNPEGKIALAFKISDEAVQSAEKSGDLYSKAMAYISLGVSWYFKGFLEEALRYLLMGADLSEKANIFVWSMLANTYLGGAYLELKEYENSKEYYRQAIRIAEQNGLMPSFINARKISLAKCRIKNNERDLDLESLYAYSSENKARYLDSEMAICIGEILLNFGEQHLTAAEAWIRKAIDADSQNGMRWQLGQDYATYSNLFRRKADHTKAKENLSKAIEILKECGADGWVEKYEKELAEL